MTLSWLKIHIASGLLLFATMASAADPPEARMGAALAALQRAEAMPMRGPSAEMLAEGRDKFALAQQALAAKKAKDAIRLANEAEAAADLAIARFRYNFLRYEIENKTSRNTQLRRRLLVAPGSGR